MLLGMPSKKESREVVGPYPDQSSRVQAVVSDSGPIDLICQHKHDRLRYVVEPFIGGPPEGARLETYRRASPM